MDDDQKLEEIHRALKRQDSFRHRFWSGVIFGIGSTIGLAVVLYLAVLLVRQLQGLPLVGQFFGTVSPTLERTLEDRVPNVRTTPTPTPAPKESTTPVPQATEGTTITGSTAASTDYFSLTLPAGWDIKLTEGSKGVQRSRLQAQSDDFRKSVDESADGPFTPISYEDGAALDVHVTTTSDADHGGITSTKSITLDGVAATYHVFTEPSTVAGQQLDVHATKGGLAYTLTFTYNPETEPNGPEIFDDILAAFKFKSS